MLKTSCFRGAVAGAFTNIILLITLLLIESQTVVACPNIVTSGDHVFNCSKVLLYDFNNYIGNIIAQAHPYNQTLYVTTILLTLIFESILPGIFIGSFVGWTYGKCKNRK